MPPKTMEQPPPFTKLWLDLKNYQLEIHKKLIDMRVVKSRS